MLIEIPPPPGWRDLQRRVARILSECGLVVEIESTIATARGSVEIDVLARDIRQIPPGLYLCECKHWNKRAPKSVVHSLRTVVDDSGANWGLLISSRGYQRGAVEAVQHSNIRLLDWREFQELFLDLWLAHFMVPFVQARANALIEYTEPINSRIFRKADQLPESRRQKFIELRARYLPLAIMFFSGFPPFPATNLRQLQLPLEDSVGSKLGSFHLPAEVLAARDLRSLLEAYSTAVDAATAEFDMIFGERA